MPGRTRQAAQWLAHIYKGNGWVWHSKDHPYGGHVPDEDEIYDTLKHLKKSAKKCKGIAATGRLFVRYNQEDKDVEYLLEIPYEYPEPNE